MKFSENNSVFGDVGEMGPKTDEKDWKNGKDGEDGDYRGEGKTEIVGEDGKVEVGKVRNFNSSRKKGYKKRAGDVGKAMKHMVNRELKNLNSANHDSFTRKSDRKRQKTDHLAYAV
jgi:hypothetical protein